MVSHRLKPIICAGLVAASSLIVMAQNDARTEKPPPSLGSADEDLMQLFRRAKEYWDKGDYTNALPLYERTLAITESTWGKDNPELAKQLIVIGTMHSALGEPDKALPFFKRFVEITDKAEVEKSYERERITALINMGQIYRSQQSFAPATAAFEGCVALQEKVYGQDSTNLIGTLDSLADLHAKQASYEKALSLYQRALEICQKAFGEGCAYAAILLSNMAGVWERQGHHTNAAEF